MSRSSAPASSRLFVAEPPASYLPRPALVVDCSVLAAALFEEPTRDVAFERMAGRSLHAPSLLDYEIASVALKKRRGGWPVEAIASALQAFAEHDIEVHRTDITEQCRLAEAYELSPYDAAYLWLAAELRAPLASFDKKLGEAAQRHLGSLG